MMRWVGAYIISCATEQSLQFLVTQSVCASTIKVGSSQTLELNYQGLSINCCISLRDCWIFSKSPPTFIALIAGVIVAVSQL